MNNIHRTVERCSQARGAAPGAGAARPSATALSAAFAAYEAEQRGRIRQLVRLSNEFAKITTYATPLHRLLAEWVMPLGDERIVADQIGRYVAAAPRLGFLPSGVDGRATRLRWGGGGEGGGVVGAQGRAALEQGAEVKTGRGRSGGEERREEDELASYKAIVDELSNLKTSGGIASRA